MVKEKGRWMSTEEAAAELGITTRTLYRAVDDGRLTAYRFGRVIRFRPEDIETYMESCRIKPGSIANLACRPAQPGIRLIG